jgi:hypothetical protein
MVAICTINGKGQEDKAGLAAMKRIAYEDRKWSNKACSWIIRNADKFACTVQAIGTSIRLHRQERHQL